MKEDSTCLSQWEFAREMDRAWRQWRQFSEEMASAVTGLDPVWFFFYGDMWRDWSLCFLFMLALMNSSRESLLHWIMLLETCYSVFGKSLTTELMCATSQVVHILNTNEISPRVNFWSSTPKLFNFIDLDWVVLKIIASKMVSNVLGHPVYKLADRSRERSQGSMFNSYYTEM